MITPKWFVFQKVIQKFLTSSPNFWVLLLMFLLLLDCGDILAVDFYCCYTIWLIANSSLKQHFFLVFMLCSFFLGSHVVLFFFFTPSKVFFLFWESSKVFFSRINCTSREEFFNLKIAFIFMMTIQIVVQLITFLGSIKGYRTYQW